MIALANLEFHEVAGLAGVAWPVGWFPLWFAALVLLGIAVNSLAGFGANMVMAAPLVWLTGNLQLVVVTLLMVGIIQSSLMAWVNRGHVQWHALPAMVGWSLAGLPVGLWAIHHLARQPLLLVMGLVIITGGLLGTSSVASDVPHRPFRAVDRVLLVAAGMFHSAFACGGATAVLALRHGLPSKQSFRSTIFMFWLPFNLLALVGNVAAAPAGVWRQSLLLLALGVPSILLGNVVGQFLALRVSQQRFSKIVAALLVLAGCFTIYQNLPHSWSANRAQTIQIKLPDDHVR